MYNHLSMLHLLRMLILLISTPFVSKAPFSKPQSQKEVSSSFHWQHAMQEELAAPDRTHTWDIVELPPRKTTVGGK